LKVALKADAGIEQGSGHVVRSLTLAQELMDSGHEVHFLGSIQDVSWLSDYVSNSGIEWQVSPANKLNVSEILRQKFELLIVDSYAIASMDINSASRVIPTLSIVDFESRGINTQFLLDQNFSARRYKALTQTKQLLGPRYALVRREMRDLRRSSSARVSSGSKPNVLVMLGGTDPKSYSILVSSIISDLDKELNINFVTSSNNFEVIKRNLPHNAGNLHLPTPRVEALLKNADVVISAAGTSALDISCIGIPAVYLSVAQNQNLVVKAISDLEIGVVTHGESSFLEMKKEMVGAITSCVFDDDLREKFFINSQKFVDGMGATRVASTISLIEQGLWLSKK
jgi:UDP-2,4-diacetamido-2,4,6-trideoxy-beta-L-altropyranose hydrolase